MDYHVRHTTVYEYAADVTLSHHVLRLVPRDLPHQRCLGHTLSVEPAPTALHRHTDYFGNGLAMLTVEQSHRTFSVDSKSRVTVSPPAAPDPDATEPWDEIAVRLCEAAPFNEPAADEFRFDSPLIRRSPELEEFVRPSFEEGRPVLSAVLDLTRRIFTEFKFDPKATTIATPLKDVLKLRRGVCQDFAQLQIGCLRVMGLSARYVSGYLETLPPPGKPKLVGADASHAWVSFFCPGFGWIDVDPTNNLLPSGRHITVAWGRDYSDVSPIRGVILGAGDHDLKVSVDVTPLPSSGSESSTNSLTTGSSGESRGSPKRDETAAPTGILASVVGATPDGKAPSNGANEGGS